MVELKKAIDNPRIMGKVKQLIEREVEERRSAAGYGGDRQGDRGGTQLEHTYETWMLGLRGVIHHELLPFFEQAKKELDPEHAEYTRLKKKFGG